LFQGNVAFKTMNPADKLQFEPTQVVEFKHHDCMFMLCNSDEAHLGEIESFLFDTPRNRWFGTMQTAAESSSPISYWSVCYCCKCYRPSGISGSEVTSLMYS
jgi:hypothetical protein